MKYLALLQLMIIPMALCAQQDTSDYYYEIPAYPKAYTASAVAARVVDGLGFRYYWATAGLTEGDLDFRTVDGARSVDETIDHVAVLTQIVLNAVERKPFDGLELDGLSFVQKRDLTLANIAKVSELLKEATNEDISQFEMNFSGGTSYPFWNLLNGPIADAINHVGQIITLRRANGNPINQNISVLQGSVNQN